MKNLFPFVLMALSLPSFGMTVIELPETENGETSYLIKEPVHNGSKRALSYYSDINGACISLGYQRGVTGSIRYKKNEDTLRIGANGKVISGPYEYSLSQIVCINEEVNTDQEKVEETSFIVSTPLHPGSDYPFSYYSDVSGVCKILGYERGVVGSHRYEAKNDVLRVSEAGRVILGEYEYSMSQVVCINESASSIQYEQSKYFESPIHSNSELPFSFSSDQNGVCKALGYPRAAVGSSRYHSEKGDSLLVSKEGKVISGPYDYRISKIVCLNRE